MKRSKLRKVLSAALVGAILTSTVSIPINAETYKPEYGTKIEFDYDSENSYQNFLAKYAGYASPAHEVVIPANGCNVLADGFTITDYAGKQGVLMFPESEDEQSAQWNVNVPEEGLYNLELEVNLGENAGNDLDISLEVNDEVQFNEMSNNKIARIWEDKSEIKTDSRDNQLKPKMGQKAVWQKHSLKDAEGYENGSLKIYLKAGMNTLKLTTQGQSFYLNSLRVYQEKEIPSYKDIKAEYDKNGYKKAAQTIKFQAEKTYEKNTSTIYPVTDKTSPLTEPSSSSKIRLNTVGGSSWSQAGQNVTWTFDVPEDGLYNITVKYLQNVTSGMFSARKIMVDGEVPFKELENVRFEYSDDWQIKTLSDEENTPYEFYLTKGSHSITMEVTYGDVAPILREVNDAIFEMNEYYRKMVMISGSTPDTLRDYGFEKEIPDLIDKFNEIAEKLEEQKAAMIELAGGKSGSAVSQIQRMIIDLENMAKKPENIASRLSTYKNDITGLSAWVLNTTKQPLQLDYLLVKAPDEAEPNVVPNFAQNLKYNFDTFVASFTEDYDLISDDVTGDVKKVRVWVNLGRDQVGILKDLIQDDFTPNTDINVKLELVQGALIEATLAGRGPDVALTVASTEPVNYAIRGALADLSQFDDFEQITSERFHESAIVPFKFGDGYYAIPDTQNFEMMFYRKDILSDLGVGIPTTWKEFKQIIPIIRKNSMEVGWSPISSVVANNASTAFTIFNTLMYQRGGKYYADDLKSTDLGSEAAREAFKESTEYYINYGFPETYDFYSRFRTGDIPLAIQQYTQANLLSVGAPELKGLWDMAPLPGTVDENGNINRTQTSAVTACIMFDKTEDKESAWEFMKWFTSADVQAQYGIELEKIMGAAARYATANREAFEQIPWTSAQHKMLNEQWNDIAGVPEVPGSYYTPRGIQNAFRTAIYDFESPYETLHEWQLDIDEEIERKYNEFGLN